MQQPLNTGAISSRLAKLLALVACPSCGQSNLELRAQSLQCGCGAMFPVRGEIPDFSGEEVESVEGFQFQWEKRRGGAFEFETLYGKTVEDEQNQFYRYLGIDRENAKGKQVLDAGCGSGRLVLSLIQQGVDAVGIDLTSTVFAIDAEARAQEIETPTLIRGNLLALPLRSHSFDYIWSGGVIHHTGDTRKALRNLVRVLKPGGTIYVWVYSVDQGIFGRTRQLLPFAHRLPKAMLLGLCRFLAVPIYALGLVSGRYHPAAEIRFKLFDHLGPQFRTVHSERQMIAWFKEEGLEDVSIVIPQTTGGIGIRGRKPS